MTIFIILFILLAEFTGRNVSLSSAMIHSPFFSPAGIDPFSVSIILIDGATVHAHVIYLYIIRDIIIHHYVPFVPLTIGDSEIQLWKFA